MVQVASKRTTGSSRRGSSLSPRLLAHPIPLRCLPSDSSPYNPHSLFLSLCFLSVLPPAASSRSLLLQPGGGLTFSLGVLATLKFLLISVTDLVFHVSHLFTLPPPLPPGYFSGERRAFSLSLSLSRSTFQRRALMTTIKRLTGIARSGFEPTGAHSPTRRERIRRVRGTGEMAPRW